MQTIDKSLEKARASIEKQSPVTGPTTQEASTQDREALVDAINQVFSLLRVNYHNQFYAAFNDSETLNQAKRMWLHTLGHFEPETLLRATKAVIENSEYLPTLHQFLQRCDQIQHQLPSDYDAYREACLAADRLDTHRWTHAAVYQAGKATGWHTLRSQSERIALPQFQAHFDEQKQKLRDGEALSLPKPSNDSPASVKPLPAAEQKQRLAKLRQQLDL